MLTKLNWPTLQQRRQQFKIIMMYKIINNLILVPIILATSLFITRGHGTKFIQLSARTAAYSLSFYPSSIKLWNSLPDFVVDSTSLESFKLNLDKYLLIN